MKKKIYYELANPTDIDLFANGQKQELEFFVTFVNFGNFSILELIFHSIRTFYKVFENFKNRCFSLTTHFPTTHLVSFI